MTCSDLSRRALVPLLVLRLFENWFEKIEKTRLVGTVIGAVARADAAVVNLEIQVFFGAVDSGVHRADRLARRTVALHAQNR